MRLLTYIKEILTVSVESAIELCGVLWIDNEVPGRKAGEAVLRLPGREIAVLTACSRPSVQQPS
jgi:hypothetical protein